MASDCCRSALRENWLELDKPLGETYLMRIRFPFFYDADVVMGRTDRIRTETFMESFEIDVPELTSSDMPVALTYLSDHGRRHIYRYYNGQFASKVTHPDAVAAKELVSHSRNLAARSMGRECIRSVADPTEALEHELTEWYQNSNHEAERKPNPMRVKEWFSGTRGRAIEVAQKFAAGIAILDGHVWFPVEEPKFGVTRGAWTSLVVTAKRVDYPSRAKASYGHPVSSPVFNMNALADADAYRAANMAEAVSDFERGSLEILTPEVFIFDRGRHAIEWAAMASLDVISSSIRDRPDAAIGRWMDLRRLFESGDRSIIGWDESVARSIEELLPLIRSIERRREIEAILEVWSESTISLDLAHTRQLAP
jgi:hypothetical protein